MNKIIGNSLLITVLNGLTLFTSFLLYPIITTYYTPTETDIFFLALTIPLLIIGPLANAVGSVMIPVLAECWARRPKDLETVVGSTLTYTVLVAILGAIVFGIMAPLFQTIGKNWYPPNIMDHLINNIYWLLPLIALQAATAVLDATANTAGRFWLPASAALFRQAFPFVAIPILQPQLGFLSLPIIFMLAGLLHLSLLLIFWPRDWVCIKVVINIHSDLKKITYLALPTLLSTIILQMGILISRLIASQLGQGSVTALEYANRAAIAITELTTNGVLLVILSDWSHSISLDRGQSLKAKLYKSIKMINFLIIPIVAIIFALRYPLIELWLGNSQLDRGLLSVIAATFGYFLLGIPLDIAARIYVRFFLVRQATRVFILLATVRIVTTIGLSLIFMNIMGVLGLALADTIGIGCVLFGLTWMATRFEITTNTLYNKNFISILLAAITSWLITHLIWETSQSYLPAFINILTAGFSGIFTYIFVVKALKLPELSTTYSYLIQILWVLRRLSWSRARKRII